MALTKEELAQIESGINMFMRQPVKAASLMRKFINETNEMLIEYQKSKQEKARSENQKMQTNEKK